MILFFCVKLPINKYKYPFNVFFCSKYVWSYQLVQHSPSVRLLLKLLEDVPLLSVGAPGVAQPGIFVGAGVAGGEIPHNIPALLTVSQGTFVRRLASRGHLLTSLLNVRSGSC